MSSGSETGMDPAVDTTTDVSGHKLSVSISDILTVIAPVSLLTGVFYYFGYVSARTFYSYFGVSLSVLNLPVNSYLLGDVDTFFKPVAVVLIIAIFVFAGHQLASRLLGRFNKSCIAGLLAGIGVIAVGLAGFGLFGLFSGTGGLASALSLTIAGLLTEYIASMMTRLLTSSTEPEAAIQRDRNQRAKNLRRGLLLSLVLVGVFWAVTDVARQRGITDAQIVEISLPIQSQAVVYSDRDLDLPGADIGKTVLPGQDSAYRYRYNGLRPLLYAHDRWFLLPVSWTHDNGETVIVLEDDPGHVRVDLAP